MLYLFILYRKTYIINKHGVEQLLKKKLKRIAISALALLAIFIIAGIAYVYLGDRPTAQSPSLKTVAINKYTPITPAPDPGVNATVGVAEEAFDSPAAPGANTSIIINSTAGATCSISVTYNGKKSTDPALAPKIVDPYGNVTWSWTIPPKTPFGSYPVVVTCRLGSHWATYDDNLVIKQ